MNDEQFNEYCQSFKATNHVVQWGNSDVWKVDTKVFAVGGWTKEKTPAFTFKTSEQNYYFLCEKDGYRPAPYLASRGMKWIQQYQVTQANDEELRYYIAQSYRIVSLGLTKKRQKELGLNQNS